LDAGGPVMLRDHTTIRHAAVTSPRATSASTLANSHVACSLILGQYARSFSFASRFLPREKRMATAALYAFFRTVDNLVDERDPCASLEPIHGQLNMWRDVIVSGRDDASYHPLLPALQATLARYAVPRVYLLDLLDGIASDLTPRSIPDFPALRRYCYQVAGTVGLAMTSVLGLKHPDGLAHAEALGIAMQLTNVLRDVGEDLKAGHIYLPLAELARHHVTEEHLSGAVLDANFCWFMREQIARARQYYAYGRQGLHLLEPDARFPIAVASVLYEHILTCIERNNYDVFSRRAATTRRQKLFLVTRAYAVVRAGPAVQPAAAP